MDEIDPDLRQSLSDAAELLLPVANASEWPCAAEISAWLTAVRDIYLIKPPGTLH